MPEEYEGFSNRETWAIACNLDNEADYLRDAIACCARPGLAHCELRLRQWIEGRCAAGGELTGALLECALARVNWNELARHYIAKARDGAAP